MIENVLSIISTVFVVAVFVAYFVSHKGTKGNHLASVIYFLIVLVTGSVLHLMGLLYNGTEELLLAIVHSIISSIKMFAINLDINAISKLSAANVYYLIGVSLCYFTAIIGTSYVVVNTFGKNIINSIMIAHRKYCEKIIIIGDSDEAKLFIKSLNKTEKKKTIIILGKKDEERKKQLLSSKYKVIADNVSYSSLKKAGLLYFKKKTTIIAMAEEDEINLQVAKIITDYFVKALDIDIVKYNQQRSKYKLSEDQLFCLSQLKVTADIMYNYLERTEHFEFVDKAFGRIKFFNTHELRARKFLLDYPITKLIPSEWINTKKARLNKKIEQKETPIKSFLSTEGSYKISNIFIGFSASNRHLLKKTMCNGQILGCDYHALVLDKNIDDSKMQFINNSAGVAKERLNLEEKRQYLPHPSEEYQIDFVDAVVLSLDFYDKVIKEVKENDYSLIFIALEDDRLSIETALEIRQKLCEYKDNDNKTNLYNKKRVKIFVKIIRQSVLSDDAILNINKNVLEPIIVFGADKEVLNVEYIVNELLDQKAITIANSYANIDETNKEAFKICNDWDRTSSFKRESNRFAAMSIQIKLNLLGLDFDAQQNIIDIKTKKKITKEEYFARYDASKFCSPKFNPNILNSEIKSAPYETIEIVEDGKKTDFIVDSARNNLARLEHQRWNAFHLTNGWTKLPRIDIKHYSVDNRTKGRQNEITKQHACITTFEGLQQLRDLQAKKEVELAFKDSQTEEYKAKFKVAQEKADTIRYDFDLMDKIYN